MKACTKLEGQRRNSSEQELDGRIQYNGYSWGHQTRRKQNIMILHGTTIQCCPIKTIGNYLKQILFMGAEEQGGAIY